MQKIIAIFASALLLGYLVTELSARFFADNYFALLVLAIAAFIVNGFFVAKMAASSSQPSRAAKEDRGSANKNTERTDNNRRGSGDRNRGNNRNRSNDSQRQPRNSSDNKRDGQRQNRNQGARSEPERDTNRDATPQPSAPKGPVEEGEVKWFNRSKGYGFIVRPNEEEIFVHQRSIVSDDRRTRPVLRDGQQVSYVVVNNERGAQAEHVTPLD